MTGATAYKTALLDAAARYVAQGWHLFVCGNDKRPLQQGGFKNASTDLSRLDRALTRHPDGMLAVRTGAESGIVVTDVDVDPTKGIDGREWLIEAQQKGLPDCPTVETPRGGMHLYFAHPVSISCSAGRLGRGVDVRGDGGYVIAPPSKSPKGEYRWRPGSTVETLPPLPDWLLAQLTGAKIDAVSDHLTPPTEEDRSEIDREFEAALSRIKSAAEGTRNDALNRNAFLIGKMVGAGAVQHSTALERLIEAALAAGLDPIEARRTAASGLRAGMKRPWTPRASDAVLNRINQDHFFALVGHVGFVFREGRDPLTGRAALQYIAPHAFREHYGNQFVLIQGPKGPRLVAVGDAWMKWSGRRQYEQVVFAPGKVLSPSTYNLWQGFPVEPIVGTCERLTGFLLHVICGNEPAQYEYLMSWMARAVQQPGKQGEVAVVLRGEKGTGKTFFADP